MPTLLQYKDFCTVVMLHINHLDFKILSFTTFINQVLFICINNVVTPFENTSIF